MKPGGTLVKRYKYMRTAGEDLRCILDAESQSTVLSVGANGNARTGFSIVLTEGYGDGGSVGVQEVVRRPWRAPRTDNSKTRAIRSFSRRPS